MVATNNGRSVACHEDGTTPCQKLGTTLRAPDDSFILFHHRRAVVNVGRPKGAVQAPRERRGIFHSLLSEEAHALSWTVGGNGLRAVAAGS